ncbi:hypothetical protein BDDG_12955 [Blastomyces dermatitidis ATCC 18188]|uniref:Uncharacterized protein n=1 Tax=Ajellomyces dermatitidis (strain ATCC 18188 / CBS 674.68) TaxID=653446 RepID=A0A0J9ERJ3_AJEDA|nr:hypothetical protein BDDG_12955 [Blastomyces dermatitidis ATCC 18188]
MGGQGKPPQPLLAISPFENFPRRLLVSVPGWVLRSSHIIRNNERIPTFSLEITIRSKREFKGLRHARHSPLHQSGYNVEETIFEFELAPIHEGRDALSEAPKRSLQIPSPESIESPKSRSGNTPYRIISAV